MKLKHIAKRAVTFLLAVVLLTGCLIPHAANNETAQEAGGIADPLISTTSNIDALPELSTDSTLLSEPESLTEAEAAYRERMQRECAEGILADSKIADYVNTDEFFETKPMFRLTALETLNSYVVQNADNTNTVYIMSENVKYVDKSCKIREKDIALTASEKGYSVTDSDVKLLLPLKLSDGIDVNTDFGSLSLIPQLRAESAAKFNEKSNSVLYSGAFGSGSSLRYTPTLSGVKEDIILETRPEENSFEFRMETQGLYLAEEDGIYYLVSTDNKDSRIRLDQIYIYDANGRFTAGEMSVIDEGRGKFLLTVAAPREFLDDANTAYPVVIDPSLEIGTMSDTSLIIDAPVFALKPNLNAGTWQYESIGYTDSTYGLARTVVKLSGLLNNSTYQNLTADKITNVTFSAKEATGNSTKTVKLHPITGSPTWTETSVTWNNYGSFDTSANYGGTLSGDQWTNFNITNLVKAWKNGSYNGNGCFIFIMGGTENSQCRALYSTEYSGITNRPYVSMTYQANVSFTSYSIYVNESSVVLPDCNVSPTGTYSYSWSVNNNSIARCTWVNSPTTMLTGLRAGMTELNVTVTDSSNVAIGSATAMVFVLKPDGIYNISNVYYSGKLLSVGKTLSDEMDVFVRGVTYSRDDPITDRITQMWRIKHVVYNIYTFRPYYKLDMRMGRDDDNTVIVGDAGMEDTYNYQLSDYFWWITWDESEKYIIKCDNTTKLLTAASEQTFETPVYAQANSNPGLKAKWNFTNVTSTAPTGVYLYDVETDSISSTLIKYIAPEENRTIADFNLIPVAYSPSDVFQNFSWSSNMSAYATASSSGTITGISSGSAQITGSILLSGTTYTVSFSVLVTQIPNGVYFLKSKDTFRYVDIEGPTMANGTIIHQQDFYGGNSQCWVFTHLGDGYYSIKSANSTATAYYLGVENDGTATETPVILRSGSLTDGMKWKVSLTTSGDYKITPKTGEPNDRVLAIGSYALNINGIDIKQRDYVNDGNYKDEWYMYRIDGEDVMLVAIKESDGRDRVKQYDDIFGYLSYCGYSDFNFIYTDYISAYIFIRKMEDASIFVSRSHGDYNSNKTWIELFKDGAVSVLCSTDIYNSSALADFSSMEIAIFAACNTAKNSDTGNNLADASVNAGANYAIGFTDTIYCSDANNWVKFFFYYFYQGFSVEYSCTKATLHVISMSGKCYIAHLG